MIELKMSGICEGCKYFMPKMVEFFAGAQRIEQRLTCENSEICERLYDRIVEYVREHPPEGGGSA